MHTKKISWSTGSFCRAQSRVKVVQIFRFIVQPHREKQQFLLSLVPFGLASSCVLDVCLRDLMSSSSSSKMVEWRGSQTVLMLHTPGGVCACAFPSLPALRTRGVRLHLSTLYSSVVFTGSSASLSVQTHSSSRAVLSLFLLSRLFFFPNSVPIPLFFPYLFYFLFKGLWLASFRLTSSGRSFPFLLVCTWHRPAACIMWLGRGQSCCEQETRVSKSLNGVVSCTDLSWGQGLRSLLYCMYVQE